MKSSCRLQVAGCMFCHSLTTEVTKLDCIIEAGSNCIRWSLIISAATENLP